MNETFVICNQLGHYWGKKKLWVDGTRAKKVMLCKHEDEGLNLLVELSAKDIDLRGEIVGVETNDKGVPVVTPSEHLLPDEEDLMGTDHGLNALFKRP
jgi:hypothetical protein